jgi:hypothetical protein
VNLTQSSTSTAGRVSGLFGGRQHAGGERTLRNTTNEELELALVEDVDEFLRDELVEAFHERGVLFLDTLGRAVLNHQTSKQTCQHSTSMGHPDSLDKLLFVLLRDRDVHPTRLQLDRHKLSKPLFLEGECLLNDIRDIILQHPLHTPMELGIDALEVTERNLLRDDHLVEARDEVGIEESAVEDGQADDPPNELEVVEVLWVHTRRRGDLKGVVVVRRVLEQAVERVEHLVREEEEEFSVAR